MSFQFDFEAAQKLPTNIRFGTSTWTYPGWKNLIYFKEYKSESAFKQKTLAEYAAFPWFRTVGIDSFFYTPPSEKTLRNYAEQVGSNFLWVSKVWERLTIPVFPTHPRYGKLGGKVNPDFLNPEVFIRSVLSPYLAEGIREHTGPFVFQFPTISISHLSAEQFFSKLDVFLGALPKDFRYSLEIRNSEFLGAEYFRILNAHGVTHCFNHWNYMPPLREQMQAAADAGGLSADFYVARILTPKNISYEKAVELFSPYDRLVQPNPEMRKDVLRLIRRAIETKRSAFVIVNNRAEGNAPMTIDAVGKEVVGGLDAD